VPLFAVGPANRFAGVTHFYGTRPSLTSFDRNGNLVAGTDFRDVFSTVLQHWLSVDPAAVMPPGSPNRDLGFLL
jgi:hypothetical protein